MISSYAFGDTRTSAVSSTCANRKKKVATPVIRCATQDHMPGSPRYSVPRPAFPVVMAESDIGYRTSNVADGQTGLFGCLTKRAVTCRMLAPSDTEHPTRR